MADESLIDVSFNISKLKVQDLKKELKLRGLTTTGNKNELTMRLQRALKSTDVISPDSGDDLEEDLLNGDDDEHLEASDSVILENELDESPKTLKRKLDDDGDKSSTEEKTAASPPPKKVILNRNTTIELDQFEGKTPPESKGPEEEKDAPKEVTSSTKEEKKIIKLSQLTAKERLEMRAKKFGVNVFNVEARKLVRAERFGTTSNSASSISSNKVSTSVDVLKQRAERFGGSVSSVLSGMENQEKMEKRKARFGVSNGSTAQNNDKGKLSLKV